MLEYAEARMNRFTSVSTSGVTGIPLGGVADEARVFAGETHTPIKLCLCVTEPCSCPDVIVWIPSDKIVDEVLTDRQDQNEQSIVEYRVRRDTTLLVESVSRLPVANLVLLRDGHSRIGRAGRNCGCSGSPNKQAYDRAGVSGVYVDQVCAGGTSYDVYEDSEGVRTTYHYIAVGSCVS
jgi:hypothetical protein